MKSRNRILAILVSLALTAGSIPLPVLASEPSAEIPLVEEVPAEDESELSMAEGTSSEEANAQDAASGDASSEADPDTSSEEGAAGTDPADITPATEEGPADGEAGTENDATGDASTTSDPDSEETGMPGEAPSDSEEDQPSGEAASPIEEQTPEETPDAGEDGSAEDTEEDGSAEDAEEPAPPEVEDPAPIEISVEDIAFIDEALGLALSDVMLSALGESIDASTGDFDLDIFRAKVIAMEKPEHDSLHVFLASDMKSPAETLAESLDNNATFQIQVAAWKALTFDVVDGAEDSLGNLGITETSYYETVLLDILNRDLESDETMELISGAYAGQVIDFMTSLADFMKEHYEMEDFLAQYYETGSLSELMYAMDGMGAGVDDQMMLGQFIYDSYPEMASQFTRFSQVSDVMSGVGLFIDGCQNLTEACKKICAYKSLTDYCGTSMVATLDQLYNNCPSSDLPLRASIHKVRDLCQSEAARIIYTSMAGVTAVGKTVLKGICSGIVGTAMASTPLGLFVAGQKAGQLLSDLCFSTDKTIEQYFLMSAYAKFMRYLRTSVVSAENAFMGSMNPVYARHYLNTISLFFVGAANGCEYANTFAEILHSSAAATFWETFNYNEFVSHTTSIRTSYLQEAQFLLNEVWQCYCPSEDLENYRTAAGAAGFITIPVESVSINLSAVTWKYDGGDHFLIATVSPANASNKVVTFSSGNNNIVSVTPDGRCTPKSTGSTTITVTAADTANGTITASIPVTISSYSENFTIEDLKYTKTGEDTVSVACAPSYTFREMESHEVPETVSDGQTTYTVTSVAYGGFRDCNKMKSISLPDTITRFEPYAFYELNRLTSFHMPANLQYAGDRSMFNCFGIQDLILPEGLLEVGSRAFQSCHIGSGDLPESLVKIGEYAFSYAFRDGSVQHLVIGPNMVEIGKCAFEFCSGLTDVTIQDAYVKIGNYAFSDCENLASIDFGKRTLSLGEYVFEDSNQLEYLHFPASLTSVEVKSFIDCSGLKAFSVAPGNPAFKAVDGVLYTRNMASLIHYPDAKTDQSFTVPDTVTYIVAQAFADNAYLEEITFPDGLKAIGTQAFSKVTALKRVVLPDSVEDLAIHVFEFCTSLESVVLSAGMEETGDYNFQHCTALKSVTLPDSITSIDISCFAYCDIQTLDLPDGLIYIDGSAFCANKALCEVLIPDTVTAIGPDAFRECTSLRTVHLPDALTNLGKQAFYNTDLSGKLVIPEGIQEIKQSTFAFNRNLSAVVVPTSVTTISTTAFSDCIHLTSLTLTGSLPVIYSDAFAYIEALTVYYPALDTSYDYEISSGNRHKAASLTWAIDPASRISVSKCTIKLSPGTLTYTGKALLPTVTVTYGGNTVGTANYSVTGTDNKKPGIATITIKGREALKGSVRKTVKIRSAKPAISKTANAATGVTINWGKVAYATGYVVYRNNKKVKTLTGGSTVSYTDTGARTNGSAYTYKIRAYVKASDGSTIYSAYSPEVKTIYLSRPTARLVNNSAGKLTVSWGKNAKATGYQVKYTVGKTTKTVKITKASAVNKVLSVRKGSTCKVYVRSYKTSGGKNYYSAWSAVKTIKITK